MGKIVTNLADITAIDNPEAGFYAIGLDLDQTLKFKDSAGVITEIGGGGGAFYHAASGRITPTEAYGNTVAGDYQSVLGGKTNTITSTDPYQVIGGGAINTISGTGLYNVISGGYVNTLANAQVSFIGGGYGNTINGTTEGGIIIGGQANYINR